MNESLHIRPAELFDVVDIQRCVVAAYSMYLERMGQKPGPMLDDYTVIIRDHSVFVVEDSIAATGDGATILGVLVLQQSDQGWLLDNVAVDPQFHGRGIGKYMIAYAESFADDSGSDHLDLYTHESMTENIAMYTAMGYVELERKRVGSFDRVYMRKGL